MTSLLLFSGSLRRHSYNGLLTDEVAGRLSERCRVDVLRPGEVDLPLFDQDLEQDPAVVAKVAAIHARFRAAEGFVIASPEYNGQLTSYLKNTVDWVSRLQRIGPGFDNPFLNRPVLLCSVTNGWTGGVLGLQHARALFSYLGALVLAEQITVPHVEQILDQEGGFAFDPFFALHVEQILQHLLLLAAREKDDAGTR